jgi:transposase
MKAYSLDLRQRVPRAALSGDHTIAEVAGLFGVSTAFVNEMLRLHRTGADPAPRP